MSESNGTTRDSIADDRRYDVAVVGGGPAGLTTALYAARLGHETAVFDRGGGRAAMMQDTHNVIGTPESVSGNEFLSTAVDQLRSYGADYRREFVTGIERIATDRRRLALALSLSALGWAVQAAGLWFAFRALGTTIPPYVPLFVIPLGAVAGGLPTPGGLGGIEAVQITLLAAATTVAAPTVTAAVAISRVGGFFLTTSLGAAAVAALKVRTAGADDYV